MLDHLVLTVGAPATSELKTGYTYVLHEALLGLTALDNLE